MVFLKLEKAKKNIINLSFDFTLVFISGKLFVSCVLFFKRMTVGSRWMHFIYRIIIRIIIVIKVYTRLCICVYDLLAMVMMMMIMIKIAEEGQIVIVYTVIHV